MIDIVESARISDLVVCTGAACTAMVWQLWRDSNDLHVFTARLRREATLSGQRILALPRDQVGPRKV